MDETVTVHRACRSSHHVTVARWVVGEGFGRRRTTERCLPLGVDHTGRTPVVAIVSAMATIDGEDVRPLV